MYNIDIASANQGLFSHLKGHNLDRRQVKASYIFCAGLCLFLYWEYFIIVILCDFCQMLV
jgi:hypothetical protein